MIKIATLDEFYNDDTICIFTDASHQRTLDGFIKEYTAPAYCVYHKDQCIEQGATILRNSTSQQGELYALLLGVQASVKYKNFKHIKIFGDNQCAIIGIREWLYNWVIETNNHRHTLGPNGRIDNQNYFMDIVYTILGNQIPIELYHIKGHVDPRDKGKVDYAKGLFLRSNPFAGDEVAANLIYYLAMGNNMVDSYSTTMLRIFMKNRKISTSGIPAVKFDYEPFNMNEYLSLVNRNGKHREFNRPSSEENR